MSQLILHPTDISQWHALVNEAQASTRLILPENTESYLVFLLMRFSQSPELAESVLAVDFLNSMQAAGTRHLGPKARRRSPQERCKNSRRSRTVFLSEVANRFDR